MATKIQLCQTKSGKTEDCPLNCAQWFLSRRILRYHIYQHFWQFKAFSGYPIFPNYFLSLHFEQIAKDFEKSVDIIYIVENFDSKI